MTDDRILVPVAETSTLRQTVGAATRRASRAGSADDPATIVYVYVHSPETEDRSDRTEGAEELLDRARAWTAEDAGSNANAVDVETEHLGTNEYVFSPDDVADLLIASAQDYDINLVLLDPEYDPGIGAPFLRPLEYELSRANTIAIEEASIGATPRRTPIVGTATALQFGAVFTISFLFYQVLAGQVSRFDLLTGAISATVVAVALTTVSINRDPNLTETPKRLLRGLVYVPYLLKEIVKSNVLIAAVILHPRLPIDPRLARIQPEVYGSLPVTTLANSITLTPGTLTVRVEGRELLVHTLVPWARDGLFDGGLERAVRGLFYGRHAMRLSSLVDRDAAEIVSFGDDTDSRFTEETDDDYRPTEDSSDEPAAGAVGDAPADASGPGSLTERSGSNDDGDDR